VCLAKHGMRHCFFCLEFCNLILDVESTVASLTDDEYASGDEHRQEDEYGNDEKCCIGMTTPWSMMSFPGWAEKSRKITRLALRIVH
jgi:hypothetical protein